LQNLLHLHNVTPETVATEWRKYMYRSEITAVNINDLAQKHAA